MLELQFPNQSHKEMHEDVIAELERYSVDFLHPASTFTYRDDNYWEFVEKTTQTSQWKIEWLVPADTYFAVEDDGIIWAIQLRHHIDHPNLEYRWGHIGYWVRPSKRGNGYATKMLHLVLDRAREILLDKVLITCDINNIWSNKVIQKNWGILEKECLHEDGTRFNRYWITL